METALLPINRQCLFNKGMQKKKKNSSVHLRQRFTGDLPRGREQQLRALLEWHLLVSKLGAFKGGTYAKMEIFLTHSRMKLPTDQSCTAVRHHRYHRTPT